MLVAADKLDDISKLFFNVRLVAHADNMHWLKAIVIVDQVNIGDIQQTSQHDIFNDTATAVVTYFSSCKTFTNIVNFS